MSNPTIQSNLLNQTSHYFNELESQKPSQEDGTKITSISRTYFQPTEKENDITEMDSLLQGFEFNYIQDEPDTPPKKSESSKDDKHTGPISADVIIDNGSLKAITVVDKELQGVSKIAKAWRQTADSKEKKTDNEGEKQAFKSSVGISAKICHALQDIHKDPKGHLKYSTYKCVDMSENIQGLMVIEKRAESQPPYVYIKLIATHPNNLQSKLNESEPNRVRGAGVCLIECATELARKWDYKTVQLEPSEAGTSFYENRGFTIHKTIANGGQANVLAVLNVK